MMFFYYHILPHEISTVFFQRTYLMTFGRRLIIRQLHCMHSVDAVHIPSLSTTLHLVCATPSLGRITGIRVPSLSAVQQKFRYDSDVLLEAGRMVN